MGHPTPKLKPDLPLFLWFGKLQQHKWFRNVDWVALRNRRVNPPWVPPSMKPGCTQCFLDWKAEPPAGAGAAGVGGGEHALPPSDQVQEYSRIKVPPGCALRPPPPPQQPAPGELDRQLVRCLERVAERGSERKEREEPLFVLLYGLKQTGRTKHERLLRSRLRV